ncbi:ATP-dependent DNA helicase [Ramlibacter tataouinensis]|uniref:ATP-dependent helicases-like protein n=1 Tax=Ramlibacter tataouinensis (strain ATCC BAA-407 / DSM 14655 / LMG 21543 / TTB310) TaxID=365046 RepID=F5XYJ5_RAMTT|nr:ATP-dependent DNA helicase [Ramlibacter tataouinensis]AEG93171.1 ATP-dependent helicases-like protein [Ramlibacter tataouinensis TTB310]
MKYGIAVRTLCEFTARQGDLDLRFTPSPTAQQGIAGHQQVAARRRAGYQSEIALQADFGPLTVRGRADGWDPALQQLEEIKTHRGDLARQPANHRHLHWAQLKVYGWLLCQARGLAEVRLALVYYDIASGRETVLAEVHGADSLRVFFEEQCGRFLAWAEQELAHRQARDAALAALAFPHADFRPGQRMLAEAVWRAAASGRCLLAQAPTGIGKTVGTLFPLLKACPGQRLDQVFYLAAKTPGRTLALEALRLLAGGTGDGQPLPLRVLELAAREKACEHPDKACHGESCPLARGFYDRLPAARAEAIGLPAQDRAALREVALRHQVCPYWLGQELARWADVVVGDYNYFFDATALLHALTAAQERRVALLVDEAHNLLERARGMYSAELDEAQLLALRRQAPVALKRPLERLARAWRGLQRDQADTYAAHDELPGPFMEALQQAAAAVADHLAEAPAQPPGELQQFCFDALAFGRLAETFGTHSLFDVTLRQERGRTRARVCIRNLIPAPHLAPRFAAAHTATLFSATLGSAAFCRDTLGLPADTAWVEVNSPFVADQLAVHVVREVSTRYADRGRSVAPIVRLMARQWRERPGNYLAFFSSYDYLRQVAGPFADAHPEIPVWQQSPGMRESEREAFLARFVAGGSGIAFAVLGGPFAEGIDLPGERLVGAFIATLGLPQVNPVNERLKQRLQQAFGAGYDYAYLYPGLQKVVQAAGRVIRGPEDRGVVYLIDDRFQRPQVRGLLPRWWQVDTGRAPPSAKKEGADVD